MDRIYLSTFDLALASSLVIALALINLKIDVNISKRIIISAVRMTIQLLLIALVLKVLFENATIYWVALMALIMLLFAGREVMARQHHRFTGASGYLVGTTAMVLSSFTIAVLALVVMIGPDPWYQPQYAIPLLGMLLGNTMNGIALALERLTSTANEQRQRIEAQLILGYTAAEAISSIRRDSIRVGLIPMINSMAAAGIVSLPGMMTGQILAGTPPMEAVKYQLLIMFLITAGTGLGTMVAVNMGAKRLFDERQRLRLDRLMTSKG
jgi:putative ABC transport system permease protein